MSNHLPAIPEDSPALPERDSHYPLVRSQPGRTQLGPEPDKVMDWRRYVSALFRHKWSILLSVALGTAAGMAGSRLVDLEYMAEAAIWIENPDGQDARQGPIRSGQLLESFAWVELLRSYVVLDHVVEELKLYLSAQSQHDPQLFDTFSLTGSPLAAGSYVLARMLTKNPHFTDYILTIVYNLKGYAEVQTEFFQRCLDDLAMVT